MYKQLGVEISVRKNRGSIYPKALLRLLKFDTLVHQLTCQLGCTVVQSAFQKKKKKKKKKGKNKI
jgi:hypothetical protein